MADSKKNDNDDRSPRFSKALMGRVVAVGLFVVLGTFAVATSMNRSGEPTDQVALNEASSDDVTPEQKSPLASAFATKPPASSQTASRTQSKPVIQGTFKKPASSGSVTGSRSGNSTNGFAIRTPAAKPKVPTVNTAFARKPFPSAQPSAAATSSSRSTFGSRPKPPAIKPVQPSLRPTQRSGIAASAKSPTAQGGFGAFKTNVVKTTNELAGRATSTVKDTAEKANSAIQTRLNGLNSPASSRAASPISRTSSRPNFEGNASNDKRPAVAFDTSRNLKPVAKPTPTRPSQARNNSSSRPLVGGNSFGQTASSRSTSAASSRPAVPTRSTRSFERSRASAPSRPVARTAAARSAPAAAVVARTSDAPGDRELEGVQAPALTVEKVSPREIQVNREADFAIVIRNVGRAMAQDVRVFDEVPAGTEFLASSPKAARSGQRLEWKIGNLRPGQEKKINLQLKPTRPGEIGSVAHVTFATQATTRTRVTKPVLEIRHSARPKILIGDPVVFDVVVENKGDGPATNVIVQEDVPQQLEFADGYRELEYEIGTLMPGQSKRVQLGLKAAEIGRLRNVMFASASGGLRAKHEIDMEIIAPKLVTSSEGATRRFLQRKVEHKFNVENSGTAKATNVELVARLPSGLRFVGANNQGRYDRNSHAVFWSLAELQPSIKAGVALETMPVEVGEQDIKFEAFADLNQKSTANQPLSVEHLVDVFFDIDDVVDPIEIGADTSYRIRIVNQGTKTASNVKLQVDFPNGLQPTGVEGNLRNEIRGQQVVFAPISTLSPGDEISVIVRGKGTASGDHRVSVNLQTDGRQTQVTKQETTRVYADR